MKGEQAMEEYPLNKKQLAGFITLIALCVLMNFFGNLFALSHSLPLWLDSTGTVLAAYLGGPVCGALVGVTGNVISHIAYGDSYLYAIVSIAIGVVIGLAARKKGFESLFNILTTAVVLAITTTVVAIPLLVFVNNSTGNIWGDAVIGFMVEKGIPRFLSVPAGQLYVELIDKVLILLVLFFILKLNCLLKTIKDKGRDKENEALEKEIEATKISAILLAVSLSLCGVSGEAKADAMVPSAYDVTFNDYVQTIYSSMNGLPCGGANDIAQTNDGILWIGTYAGLYRYNGREFRWMDSYESVRNVNCLYVDEEGRLWIGTNDNGLSIVINDHLVNVIDQSKGLPANSVRSIIRSSDGYYYIGTTSCLQVLSLNYGLQQLTTLSEVLYADSIAADKSGRVAAVTNSGMLYLISKGQILSSRRLTDSTSIFTSCAFDPDGKLLVATSGNQIYRFDVSNNWFEDLDVWECGDLKNINDLTFLESGELIISADNGVGFRTPAGHFERINTNNFNNSIDNMLVDYQGNLWFSSSRLGLLRMAPSDFRDIYRIVGMDSRVVNTTVKWRGNYYFGTDKGLDAVDEACRKRVTNKLTAQLKGNRIRCMMVDRNDHLWICTYGNGLIEVEPDGTQYLYNSKNLISGNRARVVKELADGTIICAENTGISFIKDHMIVDRISYAEGKISSMVLTVSEMPDGTILAGTDGNGIAVLENRKVTHMLTKKDGLSSEVILRTILDEQTGGVFIVAGNGLCYMEPDKTIRPLDTFPYFNNYDIWIHGTDKLFVMSSAGIYLIDRKELLSGKAAPQYELLDSRRGLNSSLTANSWTWFDKTSEELFLACDTGAFAINTGKLSSGAKFFRMSIPYARLDGEYQRVDRNTPILIPRETSKVELHPEVINYTIQDPYVGYKIDGFDNAWNIVPQNSLNTIVYTNLPPGTYTFHLAVFDNNQQNVVAERTYTLSKKKELYDSPWFILYLLTVPVFTACWITWLLIKRREDRIERELAEANRQVEMGKQTVIAIARTVDAKDPRTGGHSRRVALYSKQMAKEYGLSDKDCQDIEWAANMHDIGKIAIPDAILNKDSRLTDDEYAIMKSHTIRGAEILSDFTLLDHVIEGAEYHHERYDGRGYPKGLKGEDIPLYARIIGVADAFDAMTANRIYRKQMDFSYVLNELEKGRGLQFDGEFVDILLKLIRDGVIDLNKLYGVKMEDTQVAESKQERDGSEMQRQSGSLGNPEDRRSEGL